MTNKITLPTLIILFTFHFAFGQRSDSLKDLLHGARGAERVDILYELGYNQIEIEFDYKEALKYGIQGHQIALELKDSLRIVRTGLITASALRRLQRIDSSLVVYRLILAISEKNRYHEELALALNSMAIAYNYKAQYDSALQCYFRSLRLREASGDVGARLVVLQNIALVYYKLKDYQRALDIFLQCYEIRKKGYHDDVDIVAMNIGHCYAYLGDFDRAAFYIEQALAYCGRNCISQRHVEANFAKGVISYGRRDFRKAEQYFSHSYALARTLNDIRFQLDNVDYLSKIFMVQNRTSVAVRYLEAAENLIKQNSSFNLERIKIYSDFSKLYLQVRHFERASHYQLKYSALRDSIYNEEMTRNLMKAEAEFLERENTEMIVAQKEVIALKEEVIRRQRVLNKVTGLMIFIFAGFVLALFRSYRQKRNLNCLLERKVNERTRELQLSHDRLLNSFQEHELLLNRAAQGIRETMHTIKGLCFTGMRELSDPVAQCYMSRIDSASGNLAHYLQGANPKNKAISEI